MANVLDRLRVWDNDIVIVDDDPSTGLGVKANVNSLALTDDLVVYQKSGALDVNWSKVSIEPLAKGAKTIFCIDNGEYTTLQEAVDAASSGDTILLGVKAGGWGSVIFPAEKRLNVFGLAPAQNIDVQVDGIDFSPASGANPNINQVFLQNIFITKPGGVALTFGGSVAARLRLNGCYIYQGSNVLNQCASLTNAQVGSSCYLTNCVLINDNTSLPVMSVNGGYTRIYDTNVERGSMALQLVSGTVEAVSTQFISAAVGPTVDLTTASSVLLAALSRFENLTTNATGVNLTAGSVFSNTNNIFNIATGTGYCVSGAGQLLNSYIGTTDFIGLPRNVKIQNTLIAIAYTTAFTSAP